MLRKSTFQPVLWPSRTILNENVLCNFCSGSPGVLFWVLSNDPDRTIRFLLTISAWLYLIFLTAWAELSRTVKTSALVECRKLSVINVCTLEYFYTSVLTVPFVILMTMILLRSRKQSSRVYWRSVNTSVRSNAWPLIIVGVTYIINMLATYQAKITAPNQAYVGAIKAASVIPVVILGVLFFNEKVSRKQWLGIGFMLVGMLLIALNIWVLRLSFRELE